MPGVGAVSAVKQGDSGKGPCFPFRCSFDFPKNFRRVWGFPARCAICAQEIQGRETIRWRESGNPRSVVHAGCEEAMDDVH